MELTIRGTANEIADLILQLQGRQEEVSVNDMNLDDVLQTALAKAAE